MAKPKILLLSDDLRMNSGIATMSRELVLSTAHKFDWVQLAGAITHPEKGKVFDLSQSVNEQKKIKNAYVKVIPTDGYGNEQTLFQLIAAEKPNAILHFTDPRFWGWLYALEHQIRGQGIPICYLAIWDDIPYPMYNRPFYESCDAIFGISKQSNNIHTMVLEPKNCCTLNGTYDSLGNFYKYSELILTDEIKNYLSIMLLDSLLNTNYKDVTFTEEFISNNMDHIMKIYDEYITNWYMDLKVEEKGNLLTNSLIDPRKTTVKLWVDKLKLIKDKSKALSDEEWKKERPLIPENQNNTINRYSYANAKNFVAGSGKTFGN